MPKQVSTTSPADQTLAQRAAIMEQFTQLVLAIPEAPEGDVADIIGRVMTAQNLDDLQADNSLDASKDLLGVRLRIDTLLRARSDKPTRTGYYLRCSGARLDTGEMLTFTAGGEQSMAVLGQVFALRLLPVYVQFEAAPTRSGNDAINCKVLGTAASNTIDA